MPELTSLRLAELTRPIHQGVLQQLLQRHFAEESSSADLLLDYGALLDSCGGSQPLAEELLQVLSDSTQGWLEELQRLRPQSDPLQIRTLCHSVVGSAGSLCAVRAVEAARQLSSAVKAQRFVELDERLTELRSELEQLQLWLQSR